MDRILIHACCAHCLGKLLAALQAGSKTYEPVVYWYNPNIHPLIEYRRRLKAVKMLVERAGLPFISVESYGLVDFCRAVHGQETAPDRCKRCYSLRLNQTARAAREAGCRVFTSTLVTSRHQDHALIRTAGEAAATVHEVEFLYLDAREANSDESLVKMLYHQQYCGCIFSEYDRFKDTSTHLWPGSRSPSPSGFFLLKRSFPENKGEGAF